MNNNKSKNLMLA